MTPRVPIAILAVALAALGGCGEREVPPNVPPTASNMDAGDIDPEDPKAGMNTNRPDSVTDVKPGADGSGGVEIGTKRP